MVSNPFIIYSVLQINRHASVSLAKGRLKAFAVTALKMSSYDKVDSDY